MPRKIRPSSRESYWELMLELLEHLSVSAPALRSLALIGTPAQFSNMIGGIALPLLGALRQLESLVLRHWIYSMTDIAPLTHMAGLQNLKVILSYC